MNQEEFEHRVKNALIIIADGDSFKVGDLTFKCIDNRFLVMSEMDVYSENEITKSNALIELNETKVLFQEMIRNSKALADFKSGKEIEYYLFYNYGMGSLKICTETGRAVNWEMKLID